MAAVPPGAHTPNANGCGVDAKPRAWSGLKPSCPVSATVNDQPAAGVPNADPGSAIVTVRSAVDATTAVGVPTAAPLASTHTGAAKPCTSIRCDQASAGAIV